MFCLYITTHPDLDVFYLGKSGVHNIKNLRYKGSGKILKDYFKKYPKEEWNVQILLTEPDERRVYKLEEQLVDSRMLQDPRCLNTILGGSTALCQAGYSKIIGLANKNRKHTEESKANMGAARLGKKRGPYKVTGIKTQAQIDGYAKQSNTKTGVKRGPNKKTILTSDK